MNEVKKLRIAYQEANEMNVTDAQTHLASLVYVTQRAWQMWEAGDREMPAAAWELINHKVGGGL